MRDETRFKLFLAAPIACGIVVAVYCRSFLASILGMFVFLLLYFSAEGLIRLWRERNEGHRALKLLRCLSGFVLVYGALTFLVPAVATVGGLRFIGNDVEWPVGYSNHVVLDSEQNHIVVIPWIGRIQIYDAEQRFVRGWWFPQGGDGQVKLRLFENGNLQVWQAKQYRGFAFTRDGKLLWQSKITPDEFENAQAAPYTSAWFSTPWYRWALVHPFCGWLIGAVGMAALVLFEKLEKRSRRKWNRQ